MDETVYELRNYHLNEGKEAGILERFRTKETKIFARDGDAWGGVLGADGRSAGGTDDDLYAATQEPGGGERELGEVQADAEWVALKAETEKDGAFVKLHESTFMRLTDFSPKV